MTSPRRPLVVIPARLAATRLPNKPLALIGDTPERQRQLDAFAALDAVKVDAKGLNSDIHAKADYRAHLVTVMAKRAVEAALRN